MWLFKYFCVSQTLFATQVFQPVSVAICVVEEGNGLRKLSISLALGSDAKREPVADDAHADIGTNEKLKAVKRSRDSAALKSRNKKSKA